MTDTEGLQKGKGKEINSFLTVEITKNKNVNTQWLQELNLSLKIDIYYKQRVSL